MKNKAFGLWSAVFLGIGSMVGAGIFVLLGEAGAIAGNLVWISFIFGGIIALLSGYSLAKLATAYPSRGGIVEYLVECYGEGVFSGTLSILFYLSAMVAIAMVAKTFGTYLTMMTIGIDKPLYNNLFAVGILLTFMFINLAGSTILAKSENIIVITKLLIILIFTIVLFFTINPELLSIKDAPPIKNIFSAIALTFFAYEGFRVITNTAEDIDNTKNILRAMNIAILLVMGLYIAVTFAVFGNLPLDEVIKAQDYAMAEAAKPVFGELGFKIMAIAALISTASSINANLYAVTNVTYQMAKNGDLPRVYQINVFKSYEGLIVSTIILIIMVLFFKLKEIAAIGSISILFIHGFVHIGHLLKTDITKANKLLIYLAIITIAIAITLALQYTSKHIPNVGYSILFGFMIAFILEITLRLTTKRVIRKQKPNLILEKLEDKLTDIYQRRL